MNPLGLQPVSQHAAVLFFCLAELVNLNPMYQCKSTNHQTPTFIISLC